MSVGVLTKENDGGVRHSMTPSDLAENAERPIPALALLKHKASIIIEVCIITHVLATSYKKSIHVYVYLRSRSLKHILAPVIHFVLQSHIESIHFGMLELSGGNLSLKQNIKLNVVSGAHLKSIE